MEEHERIISLIELQKFDLALSDIEIALSKNPEESIYFYLASLCNHAKDEIKVAKELITKAINIQPNENLYRLQHASLYLDNNELKECSLLLDEITPANENELENKLELQAFLSLRQENFNSAENQAQQLIKLDPQNANGFGIIGFTQLLIGSQKRSEENTRRGLEIDPQNNFSRYVYILNLLYQQKVETSKNQILNFLSEDPHNQLYLGGLKLVLLSTNPISRFILKFRIFNVRHAEIIQKIYRIIFRILLFTAFFFYVSGHFLFGYSSALLLSYSIGSFPFKTIPFIQNLFLLNNNFQNLIITKTEILLSICSLSLVITGIVLFWCNPKEFRWISFGLSAIYFSGLPFDYYYGIQKNSKIQFLGFGLMSIFIISTLLIVNDEWLRLPYVLIIILLIAYPLWKRRASITAI